MESFKNLNDSFFEMKFSIEVTLKVPIIINSISLNISLIYHNYQKFLCQFSFYTRTLFIVLAITKTSKYYTVFYHILFRGLQKNFT